MEEDIKTKAHTFFQLLFLRGNSRTRFRDFLRSIQDPREIKKDQAPNNLPEKQPSFDPICLQPFLPLK
jgi:hypothetical protein